MTLKIIIRAAAAACLCLGQAAAADPLDSWNRTNIVAPGMLYSFVFGQGIFVGVGDNGTIATSTDGAVWVLRNSGISTSLFGIGFGASGFVAVGGLGSGLGSATILTSPDGKNWTSRDPAGAGLLNAVTYGGGQFVAVGNLKASPPLYIAPGTVLSSADGVTWTPRLPSATQTNVPGFQSVCYGNSRFVALGGGDTFLSAVGISTNGVDWSVTQGVGSDGASKICFGNGLFVAVGYYTRRDPTTRVIVPHAVLYSSSDGLGWAQRQDVAPATYDGVGYGGGVFVAVGGPTSASLGYVITSTSTDGINWTQRAVSRGGLAVAYDNNQFISVGMNGAIFRSGVIGKLAAGLSPSGQFLGTIVGVDGQGFAVQSSANLADWMALTNVTITDGTAQFVDPVGTVAARRFYRAAINIR